MFQLAVLIGIYSYSIFTLGILQLLYKEVVVSFTVLFFLAELFFFWSSLKKILRTFQEEIRNIKKEKKNTALVFLIILMCLVNLIGALGPELAFDALWYHLTLPKLYLVHHAVYHIPGGLLYYSDMPKLGELLYTGALSFGNEINAKVLHYIFGLFTTIATYTISRRFFSPFISLLAVVILLSNLVFAWESITAYIDLIRTFFELLALGMFMKWWNEKENKYLFFTAVLIGLAIATKVLAIGSLIIFLILALYKIIKEKRNVFVLIPFILIALLIPSPWFVFSFIHTGNPLYPIFSDIFSGLNAKIFDVSLLNPVNFINTLWNIFTHASDPLTPLYIILLPIVIATYKKTPKNIRVLYGYSIIALFVWYITSKIEGARLLLPYLPAFSILCAATIAVILKNKKDYSSLFPRTLLILIIFIALCTAGYRFIANVKYVPVIIGQQTKQQFLTENLNFSFADYYDTDGYLTEHIKPTDTVLLFGFHNLYYMDFPYLHESWVQKGDAFNYIATQKGSLPERFKNWKEVYRNDVTDVRLYSDRGKTWIY